MHIRAIRPLVVWVVLGAGCVPISSHAFFWLSTTTQQAFIVAGAGGWKCCSIEENITGGAPYHHDRNVFGRFHTQLSPAKDCLPIRPRC